MAGVVVGLVVGFIIFIVGVLFVVEELMWDVFSLILEMAIVVFFVGVVMFLVF